MKTNHNPILNRAIRSVAAMAFATAAVFVLLAQPAAAQNGTWTNSQGSGNWSTPLNWSGGIVASGAGNTATFASTAAETVTLDELLTLGNLTFNTSSYKLIGGNTLTLQTSTGNPNILVNAGTTIIGVPLSASQMVMIPNGNFSWALTNQANNLSGGLTLQANQGTFFTASTTSVPSLGGSGDIYIGALVGSGQVGFNVAATNAANSVTNADGSPSIIIPNNIYVQTIRWIFDQSASVGNVQPVTITGNVNLNSGAANVRDIALASPLTISGVVSGGGTYGMIFGALTSTMTLINPANSFTGNITFNVPGTLQVNSDGALGFFANTINFNSANNTLRALASFAVSASRQLVLTANTTLDTQTNTLEVDCLVSGAGALTKNGTGTLNLTYANTFTGGLTLNAGTFEVSGSGSLATAAAVTVSTNAVFLLTDSASAPNIASYTVNNGGLIIFSNSASVNGGASYTLNGSDAVLNVSTLATPFALGGNLSGSGVVAGAVIASSGSILIPGTTGTAGTLTFGNDLTLNGQSLQFDLSSSPVEGGGTNDEIVVGGNLNLSGGEKIVLNYLNGSLAAATYKLIKFGTLHGTFSLATTYPNVTLDNGVGTPGYVTLVVSAPSVAQSLFWQGDGTANLWNINTTANWVTNFGGTTFTYNDPAQVTFNDFGSNNVPVTLNSVVFPGAVTFNITNHAYTLAGSGKITGPESVTISGGNALTNLLQNDYSGGTVLNNASKLVLGNGGSTGAAGSGTITMGNTTSQVIVNEAAAITLPTVTGSGGTPQVIQNGSGTTTLTGSADNAYLGAVVNNGILVLGKTSSSSAHALGGPTTVNTGGTLQLGGTGGDQIYDGVTVTLAGGTFDAAGHNEGFTGLNGYGTLMDSVGSATLTLTAGAGLKPSGGTLNANVNMNLSGAPGFQVQSGGVLNLQGGTVAYNGSGGPGTAAAVNAGGVFNMSGGSLSSSYYFAIGSSPTESAFANFSGGTFNVPGEFLQGFGGVATVSFSSNAVLNLLTFSYGDGGTKLTNYFNGGLISAYWFNQRGPGIWQAFFNGSTIQARQNNATYMKSGANQYAYISTNGLIIDCQGFNIGVSQNLQHDPSLGAGLDGGLTKLGTGALTLTGTNTFNGSVSNMTGTLVFNNSGSYNNMFIGDNATNEVNLVAAAGTSLTNNTLTIGSSGSGTQGLIFNLGTFGSPSVPIMTVNGVVTNRGNVGITFTAPFLTPGMIPLMKYGSMDAANFAGTWSVIPYPYVTLILTNDTVHNLVSVIVVQGVTPVWKGNVSSEWDTTTLNWTTNGVATTYVETTPPGTPVTFNDTAVNFTVDISTATVNPALFIMTNGSHDYTFTGSYGIGGTGALLKSGAGALVLSNATAANTYSGITTVTGGSLVAGAANMLSPNSTMTFNNSVLNLGNNDQAIGNLTLNNTPLLGNGTLNGNGGALIFNSGASSFTLGTVLAGTIDLNFNGTGEMTITNDNSSDSGVWLINSGSVRVQNGNGLGEGLGFNDTAHVIIASGARIVLDGSFTIPKYFYLSGDGPDGAGCLIVTNGNVVVNNAPCQLTQVRMSTIYVSAGSSILFQGQVTGNNTKFFNGSLTKSGPGILSMDAGANNTLGMIVAQGSLVISNTATGTGFNTVNSGAALAGSGSFGYLAVAAGATLTPDQNGYIGTLTCSGGLTNAGAMTLQILKTTSATNADQIACTGGFVNTGTLTVIINAGTTLPLAAGDAFKLFTLTSYAALTGLTPTLPALPAGLGWANQLALNGSIAVVSTATVSTTPFSVGTSVSGNQLTLTWPADHTGWRLQVQTNSLSAGLGGIWVDVPGATTVDTLTFTIDPTQGTVFYRMVYP